MEMLRHVTEGEAREMVDAAVCAGEWWFRMSERFSSKTIQGATAVANMIQESERPTSINESHGKLVAPKALLKEFARQSPKEPLPSAMVKSALARVLPEAYHKTLTANTELDTADKTAVEWTAGTMKRELDRHSWNGRGEL